MKRRFFPFLFVLILPPLATQIATAAKSRPGRAQSIRVKHGGTGAGATIGGRDVRNLLPRPVPHAGRAADSTAEQRRKAGESYLLGLGPRIGDRIRVVWNSHGLPKVLFAERAALSAPSEKAPEAVAREFLRAHRALFGLSDEAIAGLRLRHQTPLGPATQLTFEQTVNGLPVFHGLVQFTVDERGQVLRAGAGELLLGSMADAKPRLNAQAAIEAALLQFRVTPKSLFPLPGGASGQARFRNPVKPDYSPVTAEPVIFPLNAESARLAWRISLELGRGRWYDLLVDASSGRLLYSRNLSHFAGRARVWRESPVKGARELVQLLDDWLPPGVAVTTGNNVDAYLDTDGDDKPDTANTSELKDGRAYSSSQFFSFLVSPDLASQEPRKYQAAAVTNVFYFANLAHDYFYSLGFDEQAGNFQTDNLNRGGWGNDAVLAEVQDPFTFLEPGYFMTTPDGTPPRMGIGLDYGSAQGEGPLDGAYSGQLVFHEYAHGVADRLVGGPAEVSCMAVGYHTTAVSEGYADYFAISFFNNPVFDSYLSRDAINGLRRASYEDYPLTFEHFANEGFESHNNGEIWAAALWDLRKALGQSTADKVVLASLKTLPCRPTTVDARDAIVTADRGLNGGANRETIWRTFARHGLGYSARAIEADNLVFDAAGDLPSDLSPGNRNPTIISQPAGTPGMGQAWTYQIFAEDLDGDALTYLLMEGPEGMTVNAAGLVEWQAGFVSGRAKIKITDGKGGQVIHGFYVLVLTNMVADTPLTISGAQRSFGIGIVDVPQNTQIFQITTRGGSGDPDVFLLDPNFYLVSLSTTDGTSETISIPYPQAGQYWIYVVGYEAYRDVTLKAGFPIPEELKPGEAKSGLSGDRRSEAFFRIAVPDAASRLLVSTTGGTGDVDVVVRHGLVGCWYDWTCESDDWSLGVGNEELLEVSDVLPGDWFITVVGYQTYTDVTLKASLIGPDFTSESITNGASFLPPVGPGAIFTIFGKKLAAAEAVAASKPLPTLLGNTSVTVNGVAAPLYYVSPLQINAQIPFETPPGEATVVVKAGDLSSAEVKVTVLPSAPGLFLYNNRAIVQNAYWQLNDPSHPATVGTYVVAYLTGVSPLDNPIPTGAPTPLAPLSSCTAPYSATIGGQPAEVDFLGMAPTFVGLGQANIKVPALPAGDHPLKIKIGEVESNSAVIAVTP